MSLADVSIIGPSGQNLPSALSFRTEANTTVINAGEPCKIGGTGVNYAVITADAEPVTTDPTFIGIAATTSTQTASADGLVDVYPAVPGLVYACKAKTASTFDTDAEILGVLNDKVPFDLTAGVYTIDVAAAGATNGLRIVGGDPTNAVVYFVIREGVNYMA